MNKKYHLFDDGNYIEFSVNNNFKSFGYQTIPSNANVYDLSSDFEEEQIIKKQKIPVFHPTSHGLLLWQSLMVIIILIYFFYIPLKIAFTDDLNDLNPNNNQAVNSFLLFSIIVLAFDLLISFNTGYVANGQVILDRQLITKHYLNLEFELDLIGVLSLTLSYVLDLDIIRLLFYLRAYYVIRFDNKIDHQLLLKKRVKGIYLLFKLILVMLFVAHIMACIFYGISYNELIKDEGGYNPYIDTWIIYNNYVVGDDWIYTSKLINRYTVSFYWAITTVSTNGYGDITPKNDSEIGWALLTMIIAGMVFAFNISSIRETLIDLNQAIITEHNFETIINRYMKTKQISLQTQERIIDYFQYIWKEERNRNPDIEELLISRLAPDLRQQLQYETYINFAQCRIFYYLYFSQDFIYDLIQYMQEQPYGPKEELHFQDSENYQYLLYLNKGEVLIYVDQCNNSINIKTRIDWVYEGQCIGQESFFLGQQFKFKAQTQSWCNIYRLSRFDFLNVIKKYQKDFELFHILITQRYSDPYEFFTKLDLKCFTCMSESHSADTCDVTHYYPNDLVYKISVRDDKLKREEYQRKLRKQQKSIIIQSQIKRIANEFNLRIKKRTLDSSFEESEEEKDFLDEIGEIKQMLGCILKEMNEETEDNKQIHKTFIPQKPQFDPLERSFCIDVVRDYEHFYPRYNLITIINRIF